VGLIGAATDKRRAVSRQNRARALPRPGHKSVATAFERPPCQSENPNMSQIPPCPKCQSDFAYEDGALLICPECGHEWSASAEIGTEESSFKDANGVTLSDGDTVTVIKDLKLKGSSQVLKVGTKVKNIRLVDGDHNIDCKIDGFGAMKLKSEFVKKV
jgi:protein PhnA